MRSSSNVFLCSFAALLLASGCETDPGGSQGNDVGGNPATGGSASVASTTGPSAPSGGDTNSVGGSSTSNATNVSDTGGVSATGGSGVGKATGGAAPVGGGAATGGATPAGGSGTGKASGGAATVGGSGTGKATGGAAPVGGSGTGKASGGAAPVGGSGTGKAMGGAAPAGGAGGKATGGAATVGGTTSDGGVASTGGTGSGGGDVYNPDFVEFSGENCTVPDPKDVNFTTLNDLFAMPDGSRMAKKSDWRCQRAYLKKIVEKYIHGPKPGTPTKVTGTVSKTSISVRVEHNNKTADFSVSVSLPSGANGPVPIIIGLGGVSGFGGTASLPDTIKGEGVATGSYDHGKISDEKSRSGLFSNIYGTNTGASAQIGWAWGISRVIDVLVAEKAAGRNNIIDPTAVGITGCSRNGKGAFTIGAFDERIALGLPQESGTAGVSALRIVNTSPSGPNGKSAQSISSAMSEAAGWFGTVFSSYNSKVNTIPGDMHSLVAMYAPRGLLVLDNSRIGELCSSCQHAASAAGQKVYEALGVGKNVAYNGGNPGDPHDHCAFYTIQVEPLKRAIRAHLTKKAPADGRIEPQPVGTADLTKWINWTAPTLANDMNWDSPPVTSE